MSISFNNLPTTTRTPNAYTEIDNSRALKGLYPNPHAALIIGQKRVGTGVGIGTAEHAVLYEISRETLADGYFGVGSILARMCNTFKKNNPNTELFAMALSGGTAQASARICFSRALSHTVDSISTANEALYMMINGKKITLTLTKLHSGIDLLSYIKGEINKDSTLPCTASHSVVATSIVLFLSAICSGEQGNYLDVRFNYYAGESNPVCFKDSILVSGFEGGAGAPDLGDAWAVIDERQMHYIIQPYIDAANLIEIEDELTARFKPLEDMQGHGFACVRGTLASCTTLGNSRNNAHNTILGMYNSPTSPEEWAAALGAQAADKLNSDPGRPLQMIELLGILPPPKVDCFTQSERNNLLYDGIATWIESAGKVLIERCITTYQTNALGTVDPSFLDVETLAILSEIRYQFKARMTNRFIMSRYKLADDTFPVQPGTYVVTPKTIKQEIISLFTLLQDKGLIENLDEFITNLVVERNITDVNRVDVLLPPDLINQFRCIAGLIQFIL